MAAVDQHMRSGCHAMSHHRYVPTTAQRYAAPLPDASRTVAPPGVGADQRVFNDDVVGGDMD